MVDGAMKWRNNFGRDGNESPLHFEFKSLTLSEMYKRSQQILEWKF